MIIKLNRAEVKISYRNKEIKSRAHDPTKKALIYKSQKFFILQKNSHIGNVTGWCGDSTPLPDG